MNITTPLRSKTLTHTRSSSLPSRSHPLIPQFNHHLQTHLATDTVTKKLDTLDDLHNCLDSLLLLLHTRHLFARESNEKWVEQILDGYLSLVDACATAKDLLSHSKQHLVLLLISLLRRKLRNSDDLLTSRKTAKKLIHKSLRNIQSLKSKPTFLTLDKDQETIAVVSMLREAESATLDVIEALVMSVSGTKRLNGWSLVSRLIGSRKTSGQDHFEATLDKLVDFRTSSMSMCDNVGVQIDELQMQLRETEKSLCVIEDKVENLYKRLIRIRVSLLNMHSQ